MKKDDQLPGNIPFVMAGVTNTGVVNYVSNPVASFPANSITVDIFGNTFYRNYAFGAGDDTGVYWNDSINYSKSAMMFFAATMQKALTGKFSYGKKLRSSQSLNFKMILPKEDGRINFDFIESFVAELEAHQIVEIEAYQKAELETYLTVCGFDSYELSVEELNALQEYPAINWKLFNIEKLFGKSTRGKRLKSADRIVGDLPFVTAGEVSEGISAYIGNKVEVFSKNTTTIDMFGSAKYRSYKYGADDHIAVVHTEKLPMKASIFVTSAIHKASHTGSFNYGHNFYAKDADALNIMLPEKDGKPDYTYMEKLISAIQKLVIKNVVLYSEQKLAATKAVVSPGPGE